MSDREKAALGLAGCDLEHALEAVRLLRTMNTNPTANQSVHDLRRWYLRDVDLGNAHCYPRPGRPTEPKS
jgi:hypothetical protein